MICKIEKRKEGKKKRKKRKKRKFLMMGGIFQLHFFPSFLNYPNEKMAEVTPPD